MSGAPRLYSIWHLNLMYSSIEEAQRLEVVQKCFWPLLRLCERGFKLGIEAPGLTLEIAASLDSTWIQQFKELLSHGSVELVGSGYSQLIAPLVPAEINQANLREGFETYSRLLGSKPKVWMFNEQAFSNGLIDLYKKEGIETVVLDWCSAYGLHPEWDETWGSYPATIRHPGRSSVRVLWSDSLGFQKFQRHVHRESPPMEYSAYLDRLLVSMKSRPGSVFCIYGNDAEIFDFRPGRFATEPQMGSHQEWTDVEKTFESMRERGFQFVLPSEAAAEKARGIDLEITNLIEPGSVKKQPKYNLTRWALTGRSSPLLNQACWDEFEASPKPLSADSGKYLCELWSSDYRTHLTEKRWASLQQRLPKLQSPRKMGTTSGLEWTAAAPAMDLLEVQTASLSARLNPLRGLSLESIKFGAGSAVLGRLEHGTFSRMDLSADWYTGNVVLQLPGKPQVTDLKKVSVSSSETSEGLLMRSEYGFLGGKIEKVYEFSKTQPRWSQTYHFDLADVPIGSLRLGFLTFLSTGLSANQLELYTHCGSSQPDVFAWPEADFDHGEQATALVSARQCLGMTEGEISVRTPSGALKVQLEDSNIRPVAMVESQRAKEGRLIRLYFSISEHDETRKTSWDLKDIFVRFGYEWQPAAARKD